MIKKNKINKEFWLKLFSRFLIVSFFSLVFALVLYSSKIFEFFSKPSQVLNIYVPTDMVSYQAAREFEKQTGITINFKYFDTNEEFFAQFRISKGQGYDLALVSDNIVELLIKTGLLHSVDIRKLRNFKNLDSRFLNLYFDPKNQYSIPYFWSTDGIVYKKSLVNQYNYPIGWDLVFKQPMLFNQKNKKFEPVKICMLESDGGRENVFMGGIYCFGKTRNFSNKELGLIKDLLIRQKGWVEVYMLGSLQYYLLGDVVSLAVTSSAFARKLIEQSDEYDYCLPKRGSLFVVDNFVIPKASKKTELVHKFINFLLEKENILFNSNTFGYNPVNKQAYRDMPEKFNGQNFLPTGKNFEKLHIVDNGVCEKVIEDIWFSVRLA